MSHLGKLGNLTTLNLCMAPHHEEINFKQLLGRDEMDMQLEDMFLRGLNVAMGPEITDGGVFHLQAVPLKALNLERCSNLTCDGLSYLGTVVTLEKLNVSSCPDVDDDGVVHICRLKRLKHLDISCTSVTDKGLSHVSRDLTLLRHLDVSYCRGITAVGLAGVCALLAGLRSVNITECNNIETQSLPNNGRITFLNFEV